MSLAHFAFTDRARLVVEIGIGDSRNPSGQAVWDTARWDTAGDTWAGNEPTFLDVTCDVRSVDFVLGRERTTERFTVGRADIVVDNGTGWADVHPPSDGSSTLGMRPGRAVRISVDHVVYGRVVKWRGIVDEIVPTYVPIDDDTVRLSCIDVLGECGRVKLPPQIPPIGEGDTASTRVQRILNAANWSAVHRDVQTSSVTLLATDLGGQVADLLGITADSSGGAVFGDVSGRIAYRPRDWQSYPPDEPNDGVIGNVDPTDVCPIEWQRPFTRADIATRVLFSRSGDQPYIVDDIEGQALYGIEPFERNDLITQSTHELQTLAERMMSTRSADTAPRVRSVTIDASTAPNALDLLTTVDPYQPSRYLCRLMYPRGLVFQSDRFATGVRHLITPMSWRAEINLDLATPYASTGGKWDSARWDTGLWTDLADALDELLRELTAS